MACPPKRIARRGDGNVLAIKPPSPLVQQSQTLGGLAAGLVREIVGGAGKGIDGRDVGAQTRGHQPRGDRKVFVVGFSQPLTSRVGLLEVYH